MQMRHPRALGATLVFATLAACSFSSSPDPVATPALLLADDFNAENGGRYQLNYTDFANWQVVAGTVDLVGTAPFDDYLPPAQRMSVDLDGTTRAAGTLRSRTQFELAPGTYRLEFKLAGTPRVGKKDNKVVVSVGSLFNETIRLASFAPLTTYSREIRIRRRTNAFLEFRHLGGDDYGIMLDDVRFERL